MGKDGDSHRKRGICSFSDGGGRISAKLFCLIFLLLSVYSIVFVLCGAIVSRLFCFRRDFSSDLLILMNGFQQGYPSIKLPWNIYLVPRYTNKIHEGNENATNFLTTVGRRDSKGRDIHSTMFKSRDTPLFEQMSL